MTERTDRLAGAFGGREGDRAALKRRRRAQEFRRNEELEQVLKLRRERPEVYAGLPASTKTALGLYLNDREAAEAEGRGTA